MPTFLGIDPGKSGGIAVLIDGEVHNVLKLEPCTEADIAEFVSDVRALVEASTAGPLFAFLEKVSAMPKQGVSSTFKFGTSYGFLRGLLVGMRIPFEEVTPQKWQKLMGCMTRGDKNVSKGRAQQLFPSLKITHATADALLIAEYGRRIRTQSA